MNWNACSHAGHTTTECRVVPPNFERGSLPFRVAICDAITITMTRILPSGPRTYLGRISRNAIANYLEGSKACTKDRGHTGAFTIG